LKKAGISDSDKDYSWQYSAPLTDKLVEFLVRNRRTTSRLSGFTGKNKGGAGILLLGNALTYHGG
jgi:hypothetical protein